MRGQFADWSSDFYVGTAVICRYLYREMRLNELVHLWLFEVKITLEGSIDDQTLLCYNQFITNLT